MTLEQILKADFDLFTEALNINDRVAQHHALLNIVSQVFAIRDLYRSDTQPVNVARIDQLMQLLAEHKIQPVVIMHVLELTKHHPATTYIHRDALCDYIASIAPPPLFSESSTGIGKKPHNGRPVIVDTSARKPVDATPRELDVQSVYKLKDLLQELDDWHTKTHLYTGHKRVSMKDYPGSDALRCRDSIMAKISATATPSLLKQLVLIAEDCLQND